jgi:hypothetical protein
MSSDAVLVVLSKRTLYAAEDETTVAPTMLNVNALTAPAIDMVALPSTIDVAAVNRKYVVVAVDPSLTRA